MVTDDDVSAVLAESQRLGFLGARPIDEVIEHARAFVDGLAALGPTVARSTVVDLGSGGGVPGLIIANDRVDLDVTLLDRRTKRTDFLERVVRRLGWQDRVVVAACEADDLIRRGQQFDAAVARGFGPPEFTLHTAVALVRAGGLIVISEPPSGDRWTKELLEELDVERAGASAGSSQVQCFRRRTPAV